MPAEPPPGSFTVALPPLRDGAEREALRLAVHHHDLARIHLAEWLFVDPTAQAALRRSSDRPTRC